VQEDYSPFGHVMSKFSPTSSLNPYAATCPEYS